MTATSNQNLRGIWLMIAAMFVFAVADTLIKFAAGLLTPAQTTLLLTGGGLVVFAVMALAQGARLRAREALSAVMMIRYVSEICGTFCIVLALTYVPLSTVGAILQATPLVVAAGAVVFLNETVSWRRWTAIAVGFVGVLMIIKPGSEAFDLNVLWPVLAMIGLAGRDLTTRVTPPGMASAALATYTMAALVPLAALWCLLAGDPLIPAAPNWPLFIAMIAGGALGYLLIIASVRTAEVSVVSPYRYSRLIFLLIFGVTFFGERPDALTLLGAAIIIVSGIYTMWRDRLAKQR